MHNIEFLIDCNSSFKFTSKIQMKEKRLIYQNHDEKLMITSIQKIIGFVNTLVKRDPYHLPVIIDLAYAPFYDKLTMVLLESICAYIISDLKHLVYLVGLPQDWKIYTQGVISSPLQLLTQDYKDYGSRFLQKYESEIYGTHYRKYISATDANGLQLSHMLDDITNFQKAFDVSDTCRESIAEVLSELVGNACEHTGSDCLIDIDIASKYYKEDEDGEYYGINICILNFSKQLFYDDITKKMKEADISLLGERYKSLHEAFQFHHSLFNSDYTEEDFFILAAFQDKISGRISSASMGGTGMTLLIKELQQRAEAFICYIYSGNRALFFENQYLEYDSNGWIGFNLTNDFFHDHPEVKLFTKTDMFFPGTAYNLTFAMKKENRNG